MRRRRLRRGLFVAEALLRHSAPANYQQGVLIARAGRNLAEQGVFTLDVPLIDRECALVSVYEFLIAEDDCDRAHAA